MIILTAVGVLVVALGVGIAIMAVWGYQKITDHAVEESWQRTQVRIDRRLDEHLNNEQLQDRIKAMVEERVRLAVDEVYADLAPSYPQSDGDRE